MSTPVAMPSTARSMRALRALQRNGFNVRHAIHPLFMGYMSFHSANPSSLRSTAISRLLKIFLDFSSPR